LALYEAKRHSVLDQRAQWIEKAEYVKENDGCEEGEMESFLIPIDSNEEYGTYVWCGRLVGSKRSPP